MKKIKCRVSIVGHSDVFAEAEFEVEDDATNDEIEEMAKEVMFDNISWYWEAAEESGVSE